MIFSTVNNTDLSILPWLFVVALTLAGVALILLWFNGKNGKLGKNTAPFLPMIKWPLLFASAGFNIFFTYYTFLPAGQPVALLMAFVMGGVNLAEAYLVRLVIASWRHSMRVVFVLALAITLPVFGYSLMAASSTFSTMMGKNADLLQASNLRLQGAQSRIDAANAEIDKAQANQNQQALMQVLYSQPVTNRHGQTIRFEQVADSCNRGGFYKANYTDLCNQYALLSSGALQQTEVATAKQQAAIIKASQNEEMAKILEARPPEIAPTLMGFTLVVAAVGLIISVALEAAIIGTAIFEELFVKPTALPAIVRFIDKKLDWDASTIKQNGLSVEVSPSAGTIGFNGQKTERPFTPAKSQQPRPQKPPKAGSHNSQKSQTDTSTRNRGVTPPVTGALHGKRDMPERAHPDADCHTCNTPVTKQPVTHPSNTPVTPPVTHHKGDKKPVLKAKKEHQKPVMDKGELELIIKRLEAAKGTPIGEAMECAICGTETVKHNDTKKSCSPKCRTKLSRLSKQGVLVDDGQPEEKGKGEAVKQAQPEPSKNENWKAFQFRDDGSLVALNDENQRHYKTSELSDKQLETYKQLFKKTSGKQVSANEANTLLKEMAA